MDNRSEVTQESRSLLAGVALAVVFAVVAAIAQEPSAPPEAGSPAPVQGTPGALSGAGEPSSASVLSTFMEPFDYDPQGRKDPFAQPMIEKPLPPGAFHGPILPLQKFKLEQLALTGIIWDVSRPRAMIRDPSGNIHVVGPNAKLGDRNGYIAVIREGELVVIETYEEDGKLFSSARVVKMTSGDKTASTQ